MLRRAVPAGPPGVRATWVSVAQDPVVDGFESSDGWQTGDQKEIRFELSGHYANEGANALRPSGKVGHKKTEEVGKVKHPPGWPAGRKTRHER